MEEVDKLLGANFIKEVFYPDWLVLGSNFLQQRISRFA
jgi:hypothetical protein